ncbi:MAG: phosphatase PAP2 family protein [Rhizomicrobium sp.]|jgi:membrane-associated phospholipid phosphatase
MLLWAGIILLLAGLAAFAIDRRAAHYFHAAVSKPFERLLHRTTDWAKGAHWLVIASVAFLAAVLLEHFWRRTPALDMLARVSLAFLASLAVASVILHTIKILLGRRRPRDELELNLYGFRPFTFNLASDSFPSGHALTIVCVAVVMSAVYPMLAPLWFAIAIYLAMTRALLNSHYLSDVLVGAGIGLICTREVLAHFFPSLMQPWF